MKTRITPELIKELKEAQERENAFFARNGFPEYRTADATGAAHPAHRAWVGCVESEYRAGQKSYIDSPMARKMFVLGWLKARKVL